MPDINISFSEIDFVSFGGGVLAGWASAYALYRARHLIGAARQSVTQQASSASEFARRSADSRYIGDLLKYIDKAHLAGSQVSFKNLLIEPRFVTAPELEAPLDDDVLYSVFHVVPNIPDHPYLQGPYNIPTLSIEDLNNGTRSLALLGLPGSGRTSALFAIALWTLGQVDFTPPIDPVQQRLEDEEEAIENNEERAETIRARMEMEERAVETLSQKQGENTPIATVGMGENMPFQQMTPFYTHIANIQPTTREFGRRIDPAEPVLRALQHYVGRVTSQTLAGNFYERLAQGKVLLLLDGFDELPEADKPRMLDWLEAYLSEYDNNFTIVTSLPTGYGGLQKAGLAPVFLRPWNDIDTDRLADHWQENWQQIAGVRRAPEFDKRTVAYARARNRAQTPFELTLKMWKTYETENQSDFEERLTDVLARFAPNGKLDDVMPALQAAAQIQLDEGYVTAERLEEMMTGIKRSRPADEELDIDALEEAINAGDEDFLDEEDEAGVFADPEPAYDLDDDLDSFISELDDEDDLDAIPDKPARGSNIDLDDDDLFDDDEEEAPAKGRKRHKNDDEEEEEKTDKEYLRLIRAFAKSGMLVQHRGRRYQFRHPLFAAYLGSLRLKELGEEILFQKSYLPAWQEAIAYSAIHTPLDTLVKERLDSQADVLQNHALEMTHWLPYAPRDANWRKVVLRHLGNLFIAPNQYLLTRERIAAALIGSRDRNALVIFTRALGHPDPSVQRIACLGVGAFRAEDAIDELSKRLYDENPDVMLAAGLALGAIGTDDAYNEMVIALTEGPESLRQAISEAFAAIPDIGYPVLFDAIYHEDYLLRRAAVFGLRRINTPWALIALYRRSIEDDQWYVRSAAEQAFSEMQYGGRAQGVRSYPKPDTIPWLVQWMGEQAQNSGVPTSSVIPPDQIIRKALEEGDPEIQRISARNMGQLGMLQHTGILYTTLRHREETVREAALRAIADLQLQMGQPLPAPI